MRKRFVEEIRKETVMSYDFVQGLSVGVTLVNLVWFIVTTVLLKVKEGQDEAEQ